MTSFSFLYSSISSSEYSSWNLYIRLRLQERASNSLLISYLRLSVSTMFLILLMANFTFQVFFFNYSMILLFCSESSFCALMLDWNMIFVVKLIVYLEYRQRTLLNYSRFKVTCDLFSPVDMDRYLLRVRMSNEDMIIPEMAAVKLITLPTQVLGLQSPQPTVPMVIITNQTLFSNIQKLSWYSRSLKHIIWPKDRTSDMYSRIRKVRGLYQNKALIPKKILFLVLQMRQSRLARVLQQIELEMMEKNTRQIRSCIRIQKIVLQPSQIDLPQMGSVTVIDLPSTNKFGCISSTIIYTIVYLRNFVHLFCIFSLNSCFLFRASLSSYLTPSITIIPNVITE